MVNMIHFIVNEHPALSLSLSLLIFDLYLKIRHNTSVALQSMRNQANYRLQIRFKNIKE